MANSCICVLLVLGGSRSGEELGQRETDGKDSESDNSGLDVQGALKDPGQIRDYDHEAANHDQ